MKTPPSTKPIPQPRKHGEPVSMSLGIVLRQERLARKLSRNQLAQIAGIARQTVAFLETHQRVPNVNTLARISRPFGLRASQLLARAEKLFAGLWLCGVLGLQDELLEVSWVLQL